MLTIITYISPRIKQWSPVTAVMGHSFSFSINITNLSSLREIEYLIEIFGDNGICFLKVT